MGGAAGLTVAKHGAKLVVLTDVEEQLPLLRLNAEANFKSDDAVKVQVLDWRHAEQRMAAASMSERWSLIVGSDIGYDEDLLEPFIATLCTLCSAETSVVLGIADRQEDDEPNLTHFEEAAREFFTCEVLLSRQVQPHQSVTKVVLLKQRPVAVSPVDPSTAAPSATS